MNKIPFYLLGILLSIFCLNGCISEDDSEPNQVGEVEGLEPVYVDFGTEKIIKSSTPRKIERLGKIYYKEGLIFLNESNIGVHIFDNTDPANPVNIHFLEIPGCEDIAIKGNYLYADNYQDLVTIDISDFADVKVVNRIEGVNANISDDFPAGYEGYFKCVEADKGIVVGWQTAILVNPKCSI